MSEKSKSTTFLLSYYLGVFGAHRFYLKRWLTAVLMLLTFGGLGIWWLIDTVLIIGGKFNDAAGKPLSTAPPNPDNLHAGFWVRLAAFNVDLVLVQIVAMILTFVGTIALGLGSVADLSPEDPAVAQQFAAAAYALSAMFFVAIIPLYFGLQTASSHRATVGKRVFDIYVSSTTDGKLNMIRSLWRAICYAFSALPIFLGFIMAAFTKDKRALHDYLAGSKVMHSVQGAIAIKEAVAAKESPPAVPPTVTRASDEPDAGPALDAGTKICFALGIVLLAAAAAIALL